MSFEPYTAGIRRQLELGGFYDKLGKQILFPTVHDAVLAALDDYPELQEKVSDL